MPLAADAHQPGDGQHKVGAGGEQGDRAGLGLLLAGCGHPTGKQTIAEWAANLEIVGMLRSLDVDYAQGGLWRQRAAANAERGEAAALPAGAGDSSRWRSLHR